MVQDRPLRPAQATAIFRRHPQLRTEEGAPLQWLADPRQIRHFAPKTTIYFDDAGVMAPSFVSAGWIARVAVMEDGRRQIVDLILPGDVLEPGISSWQRHTRLVALTQAQVIIPPLTLSLAPRDERILRQVKRNASQAARMRYVSQIVRLGCHAPDERLCDLFLEIQSRLGAVGLGDGDKFPMPLSQGVLAVATGLSVVHINRTLRTLRVTGKVNLIAGYAEIDRETIMADRRFKPLRGLEDPIEI